MEVDLAIPEKLIPVFSPARGELRYRGAWGGRGSGKSVSFAKMAAVFGFVESLTILCTRELQNSIKDSMHAELKAAILSEPWLRDHYEIGERFIRGKNGTEFIFSGLRHNISSIKSKAGIDLCIIEEAEDVPEYSWVDLEPTIRAPKSEIWVVWNPKNESSPVDERLRKNPPDRSMIVEMNHSDNMKFPAVLEEQRIRAMTVMEPAMYAHVWEGAYLKNSKAQVFANKFRVADFEVGESWDGPYNGLDFGFSQDPTAAVECWIYGSNLYIRREAGKVGLELDDTQKYLCGIIPSFQKYFVRADSARPESISYLRRHGMPNTVAVKKGKGSVEDGIEFIRSFDGVVIHQDCTSTASEFRLYSYKVDRLTGDILSDVVDAHNHYIDAIRYALEPIMLNKSVVFSC